MVAEQFRERDMSPLEEAVGDIADTARRHHLEIHAFVDPALPKQTERTRAMYTALASRYQDTPEIAARIAQLGDVMVYADTIPWDTHWWVERPAEEVFKGRKGDWASVLVEHVLLARVYPQVEQIPRGEREEYVRQEARTMLAEMGLQPVTKTRPVIRSEYLSYPSFDRFSVARSILSPNGLRLPARAPAA